ncbi:PRA1 family protein 2-like [Sycon ciliatum]|uniref:PRA1 family protein 2-like n=1 Tax=Sycon ciliatum TaxID=27933 RepID=UPI0031F6D2E4
MAAAGNAKIPSFREDFVFGSARFSLPHWNDVDRLVDRIARNLLYYQTNYFVLYAVIFFILGLLYPTQVLGGAFLVAIAVTLCLVVNGNSSHAAARKSTAARDAAGGNTGSGLLMVASLAAVVVFVYLLGFVMIFIASVIAPVAAILAHAACRKRNLKNKLNWTVERAGLKTSLMAEILYGLHVLLDIDDLVASDNDTAM